MAHLKSKAHIYVEKGATVLGVADPSETLVYGQVHVNIEGRTILGKVVVAKFPGKLYIQDPLSFFLPFL
jgi:polygalacturonase